VAGKKNSPCFFSRCRISGLLSTSPIHQVLTHWNEYSLGLPRWAPFAVDRLLAGAVGLGVCAGVLVRLVAGVCWLVSGGGVWGYRKSPASGVLECRAGVVAPSNE